MFCHVGVIYCRVKGRFNIQKLNFTEQYYVCKTVELRGIKIISFLLTTYGVILNMLFPLDNVMSTVCYT